jgi:hypothetical protein
MHRKNLGDGANARFQPRECDAVEIEILSIYKFTCYTSLSLAGYLAWHLAGKVVGHHRRSVQLSRIYETNRRKQRHSLSQSMSNLGSRCVLKLRSYGFMLSPDSLRIDVSLFEEDNGLGSEDEEADEDGWSAFNNDDGGVNMADMAIEDDPKDVDWIPSALRKRIRDRRGKGKGKSMAGECLLISEGCVADRS